MNIDVIPYNDNSAEAVFSALFFEIEHERPDGLREVPAASYQILISALELYLWEVKNQNERQAVKTTIALLERSRDDQKMREWNREEEKQNT